MIGGDSIRIVEGGCIYRTRATTSHVHRSHALQLVVPLDGAVYSSVDDTELEVPVGKALYVASDVPRSTRSVGDRLVILLDPESLAVASRNSAPSENVTVVTGKLGRQFHGLARDAYLAPLTCEVAVESVLREARAHLDSAGLTRRFALDNRVCRALRLYRQPCARLDHPTIARRSGISPDHLSHLFKNQVGISAKLYARWVKTVAAVELMCGGSSATDAARHLRFADVAHFSRACRQHLGRSPSKLPTQRSHVFEPRVAAEGAAPTAWIAAFAEQLSCHTDESG